MRKHAFLHRLLALLTALLLLCAAGSSALAEKVIALNAADYPVTEDGWYFFGGSGAMKTAQWVQWKGFWYYLTESGKMATDTEIGGYYVNADGVWVR